MDVKVFVSLLSIYILALSLCVCLCDRALLFFFCQHRLPLSLFTPVDEDTEGSSRSGRESMSTSGDNIVGPGLNGSFSREDRQRERDKAAGKEKKKPERDKDGDKDKDKNKAKKGVLKGLGEMFR